MSRRHAAAVLAGLLLSAGTMPGRTEWHLDASLVRDDNVFCYSTADLDAFRTRKSPARFPIRTSDDLDVVVGFGFGWRYRTAGRGGRLGIRTRLHAYLSNAEKSYGLVSLSASQSVSRSGRAILSYTLMPDYLIRSYRRPGSLDTGDYLACAFSEHLAGVGFLQSIGRVTLEPRYRYEVDVYSRPFGHYDTRAHRLGAEAGWDPVRGLRAVLAYEYKLANAAGPVPDVSYRQHRGEVRVTTRPRKLSRFSLEAGYSLGRREFTTANPGEIDPGHAGRVDLLESIAVEARYHLRGLVLVAGYDYEWRSADSPFSVRIEDVKDYRAGRFGLGVSTGPTKEK